MQKKAALVLCLVSNLYFYIPKKSPSEIKQQEIVDLIIEKTGWNQRLHTLNHMAAKNKTTTTNVDVKDFINTYVDVDQKKADSFQLIKLMTEWSGFKPKMYGPTIVGFGSYHYKYASGHEGDAPLLGFSPRKTAFSLYVLAPGHTNKKMLEDLGTYKMAKACIYFKKLSDLNLDVLEKLCKASIKYTTEKYGCT